MLTDILTQYYGVDLLAMICSFIGIYTIGSKRRSGFIIAMTGNMLWLVLGILTQSVGLIFANTVLAFLYIRGYFNWKK